MTDNHSTDQNNNNNNNTSVTGISDVKIESFDDELTESTHNGRKRKK